jgi:hypothetical protein
VIPMVSSARCGSQEKPGVAAVVTNEQSARPVIQEEAMAIEKCGVALPTGDHCAAAWLLLPNGASPGVQVPCIAMAVGLGAANAMCLELFARSVTEAAIVALLFDCRQFGASGGEQQPHGARNEQLDDYRSARTFRPRAAVGQHCERPNLGRAWLRDRRMDG